MLVKKDTRYSSIIFVVVSYMNHVSFFLSSVSDMLDELGWPPLFKGDRRLD